MLCDCVHVAALQVGEFVEEETCRRQGGGKCQNGMDAAKMILPYVITSLTLDFQYHLKKCLTWFLYVFVV